MIEIVLDPSEAAILSFEVSDKSLEAAAKSENAQAYTVALCSGLTACPV